MTVRSGPQVSKGPMRLSSWRPMRATPRSGSSGRSTITACDNADEMTIRVGKLTFNTLNTPVVQTVVAGTDDYAFALAA